MTLSIYGAMPHASGNIEISANAAARANMTFNPSSDDKIARIKTLAAAFYTELDSIKSDIKFIEDPNAGRESAAAATHMQAAAVFAVQAIARMFKDNG